MAIPADVDPFPGGDSDDHSSDDDMSDSDSLAGTPGPLGRVKDFPIFQDLPHDSAAPYSDGTRRESRRGRHWCFLAQIVHCDGPGHFRTKVLDDSNNEVWVAFYLDNYYDFDFQTLKPGHTIAVMYASQCGFMDGTSGVRVEHAERVKVGSPKPSNPHLA